MQTNIVTHVDEQSLGGSYPFGKGNGIIHQLMGMMRLGETEGVDYQQLRAFQIRQLRIIDGLHICDIGQRTYAKAKDGQLAVHHLNGHDVKVADVQRMMRYDLMQSDGRHTWITVLGKAVRQHLQHRLLRLGIGIDVHLTKLAVRTDVIHTSHMVVVGMSDQDAVNLAEGLRQYLLTEIRTTVDEQTSGVCLHQSRTAQTLVTRVLALADLTLATDDWYATRCSRS